MIKKYLLLTLAAFLLTACGGSSGSSLFDSDNGQLDNDGKPVTNKRSNTYYPLDIYQQGKEYVEDDAFLGLVFDGFVFAHMIAPVDANTLEPARQPSVDDYTLTLNEEKANKDEHGLMMQKVIGLPVQLRTALIVDTSPSNQANKDDLINAIKQYIVSAQASSDPTIRNQEFTLMSFGTTPTWYVPDFTRDISILEAGLSTLKSEWQSNGGFSALYQSIVVAIGAYVGKGAADITEVDYRSDGNNDLTEGYITNASNDQLSHLVLGNVVLFSAGGDTVTYFDLEDAQAALDWQSYLVYEDEVKDEESADKGDSDGALEGMTFSGKPLFYVSIGSEVSKKVRSISTKVIETNTLSNFNFFDSLISNQQLSVATRSRLDNMYMIRYIVPQRDGIVDLKLASDTGKKDYALGAELTFDAPLLLPEPTPVLEITGPNNSYLAGERVSVSQVTTLFPAVRWDAYNNISKSGFSWQVGGVNRAANDDGSIALTVSDVGKIVVLTNGDLSVSMAVE